MLSLNLTLTSHNIIACIYVFEAEIFIEQLKSYSHAINNFCSDASGFQKVYFCRSCALQKTAQTHYSYGMSIP